MIASTVDPLFEASAAEVFASSLHDNGRASLVGTKTFGKGLIQHTFPMPDGYVVRLGVKERDASSNRVFGSVWFWVLACGERSILCALLSGRHII